MNVCILVEGSEYMNSNEQTLKFIKFDYEDALSPGVPIGFGTPH